VKIEVIARQVREDARGKRDARDPAQREGVRRHLHRAGAALLVDHLAQQRLHLWRLGCRAGGVAHLVADPVADRAEDAAADTGGVEDRSDQIGGRRLAVRAGDADHTHLAAGIAIKGRGQHGEREARVSDNRPRHVDAVGCRLLGDDRRRAALDRLPGERRAVGVLALQRDEHLSWRDRPRIVGDAGDNAHRRLRPQRIIGLNQAAPAQRAVEFSPGHGRLAVTTRREGQRSRTRRQTASPSIGAPAAGA
jgi:hypothetical protein